VALFLFLVVTIILNAIFYDHLDLANKTPTDIIIVLLPLVFTVITISLSLPTVKIHGIEAMKFRKLIVEKKTYNFLEMMIIAVIIFLVFTISKFFNFTITILALDFVSIIYLLIFIFQEIPLLFQDEKRIKKIISNNADKTSEVFKLGSVPQKTDMNFAVQHILLTEGIITAYKIFKTNNNEKNRQALDNLLVLQNNFLWKYIDDYSCNSNNNEFGEYLGVPILEALDTSFSNINDIINLDEQLDILKIYENEESYYHITRSLFSLHKILDTSRFKNKFEGGFSRIIRNIFMKLRFSNIDDKAICFLYKILNAMIQNTLSNDELWFCEILRDSAFGDVFSYYGTTEYMVFVSIYFYYLVMLENRVPLEFKKGIQLFIDESSKGKNSGGESWLRVFNHKVSYLKFEEITSLLSKILQIYDCNSNSFSWYQPNKGFSSWSSTAEREFSKELIINWWIGHVLTETNLRVFSLNENIKINLPSLNEENARIFANVLSKNWFEDGVLKTDIEMPIAVFFKSKAKVEDYMKTSPLVSKLERFMSSNIKEQFIEERRDNSVTPESLEKYRNILLKGLTNAIEDISIIDKSINLGDVAVRYFNIRFDSWWAEGLVKSVAEDMKQFISRLIYDDFNNNKTIREKTKVIDDYNANTLKEIIDFSPNFTYAYIYSYNFSKENQELADKINNIPSGKKLWIPDDVFVRNNPINANFEALEEKTVVRLNTSDEINQIIDREYKMVNGLYKYFEDNNGDKSVLLTREDIFNILSQKTFFASVAFRYKIIYNTNDILCYKIKNTSEKL